MEAAFYLGLILAAAKIPGLSKGEQGGKNQFKGINLLSSPEPLKQLWLVYLIRKKRWQSLLIFIFRFYFKVLL